MGFSARSKGVVGLDIQPGYVTAVQARPGEMVVEHAAGAPLPVGVIRDGEVADIDTLATVLRDLFSEHKLGRRVRIGVANQRIVMRTIELPPLQDPKQLASVVRFQAQDHIPMPLEQAVLEHHPLGLVETPDGPRLRVVLVAARRDAIERLLEALRRAGLRPYGIDLSAFAMIRALYRPGRPGPTLYASVGGITNVAIAEGPTCLFTRTVPLGVEALAIELSERKGLTLEHAHGWLAHVGLQTEVEDLEGDPAIVAEARHVLAEGVRRIADEVRTTIDFHRSQAGTGEVQSGVLTGAAVELGGFVERLGDELALPVEVGVAAGPGALGELAPARLTVAAGLTLDEVPA